MLHFIVNKKAKAGNKKNIWKELQGILDSRKVQYKAWFTEYEGHATTIAGEICNLPENNKVIVVVGGDGTINETINGMTDFENVKFSVIPTGSGNDFARGIGIQKDPKKQLMRILNAKDVKRIDIGSVWWNGCEKKRFFAISSGIGLDAIVCKKAMTSNLKTFLNKIHLGKLTYILLTIQTLFSMTTTDVDIKFEDGTRRKYNKLIFGAFMNFKAEGGGVPMAPSADATDGELSVCLVHGIPKWRTFFCLILLVLEKHEMLRGVEIVNCKGLKINISEPVVLHADGEYCDDVTAVSVKCNEGKLGVII